MSEIRVKALEPAMLQDYLQFFDHDAFSDNPHWASCYCHFHHAPHHVKKWEERGAEENRAAASELIKNGVMHGYLAYANDAVVGWCNANVRTRFTTIGEEAMPMRDDIGAIVCFVVAKPYRGQGVARSLLAAALEGLKQQGIASVYAFTRTNSTDAAENCQGPLSMYLSAGFEKLGERDGAALVQKVLWREEVQT